MRCACMRDLLSITTGRQAAPSSASRVERLDRLLPHRSVVFICSDFVGDNLERPLSHLAQRHDVIAVTWKIRRNACCRTSVLQDWSIRRAVKRWMWTRVTPPCARAFANQIAAEQAARQKLFARLGIDEVLVRTDTGYVEPLLEFFRARARRAHGAVRTAARPVGATAKAGAAA